MPVSFCKERKELAGFSASRHTSFVGMPYSGHQEGKIPFLRHDRDLVQDACRVWQCPGQGVNDGADKVGVWLLPCH